MITIQSESLLLPLLDNTPLDHTLYLALADIAEENGDLTRARVWRMFYCYKVCPYRSVKNVNYPSEMDNKFLFLEADSVKELTSSVNRWTYTISADKEIYVVVTKKQRDVLGINWRKTRVESIMDLFTCVLDYPLSFVKELESPV